MFQGIFFTRDEGTDEIGSIYHENSRDHQSVEITKVHHELIFDRFVNRSWTLPFRKIGAVFFFVLSVFTTKGC